MAPKANYETMPFHVEEYHPKKDILKREGDAVILICKISHQYDVCRWTHQEKTMCSIEYQWEWDPTITHFKDRSGTSKLSE